MWNKICLNQPCFTPRGQRMTLELNCDLHVSMIGLREHTIFYRFADKIKCLCEVNKCHMVVFAPCILRVPAGSLLCRYTSHSARTQSPSVCSIKPHNIYTSLNVYSGMVILYILPLWPLFMNENGGLYFTKTPSLFDVITLYVAMACLL